MKKLVFTLILLCSTTINAQEPLTQDRHIVWMHQWSNYLRATVGLPPQILCPKLCNAAQFHANYMASTGDFQHYSNSGYQGRAAIYGFTGSTQENIAMGQSNPFWAWQASGGHWAAIVSGHTKVGFGCQFRGYTPYWVGLYGTE